MSQQSRQASRFQAVAAAGAFVLGACVAPPPEGGSAAGAGLAAETPELILPHVDGSGEMDLRAATEGKVTLVDLWATWCVPCVAELPHLQQLSDDLPAEDFLMLGIVLESGGAEGVAEFIADRDLRYPNVMGSDEARDAFGPFLGYPTKYLIDKDGKLVKRYFGAVGEILDHEIGQLLATGTID